MVQRKVEQDVEANRNASAKTAGNREPRNTGKRQLSTDGKFDYHLDVGYWGTHYAGERILTFLLYLNTPLKGGGTHFRALDVNVESKAGRLLVWDNLFPNGNSNHRMIHSATPLLKGKRLPL